MVSVKITTTIEKELRNLARKHKLPLSRALEFGIRNLLNTEAGLDPYSKVILEDPKIALKRATTTMQTTIDDLNNKIKNVLEKKD